MTALGYDELRKLAELGPRPALSIVMPTHRAGGQIRQDAIRLKTKIREARDELGRWGLDEPLTERLLEPVEALLEDRPFWRQGADGLCRRGKAGATNDNCET